MLTHHLFYITERISDILELDKIRKDECSDDERTKKQIIKNSMEELCNVLSKEVVNLRDNVEKGGDEQQHHGHNKLYLDLLHHIANSADDFLNRVIIIDTIASIINNTDRSRQKYVRKNLLDSSSNRLDFSSNLVEESRPSRPDTYCVKSILNWVVDDDTASVINNLVNRIRNFHNNLPSQPTYNFITNENKNDNNGTQIIENTVILDPCHSMPPIMKGISRPKTYALYPDSDLVGFKDEMKTLLHHLRQDNETEVVGIVGMGGLGKTTLAKHIYHHPNIKTKFKCRVWVCISESWDKTSILKEICSQVIPKATKMDYDQDMIRGLSEHLRSQSYLVVLDDMWSIDAWSHISPAFPPRSNENKVVVTSRDIAVPKSFLGNKFHIFEPKPLDREQSWKLFEKKARLSRISNTRLQLAKEMVEKCKGLPLAIVALAGVLRMDEKQSNWERVSKALPHNILNGKNELTQGLVMEEVLALSYHELPHHLKQCVLYLRLFPEDYMINARNLMEMWIAEGLISTKVDQESKAEEYLDEIVQRHIVKIVKTNYLGKASRIRIHDLIRQMFIDINNERSFFRDSLRLASSNTIINSDGQSCNFSSMSQSKRIANLERVFVLEPSSCIRSAIVLNRLDLSQSILQSMFVKFRLLRVLILHESCDPWVEMPKEIGNLIHLRYLELWGRITQYPVYIEILKNLRTLNLRYFRGGKDDTEINLSNLKELRHLYLPQLFFGSINMKKLQLERLENLKTLRNVRGGEWMLLGMPGLSSVLEELCVQLITTKEQLDVVFKTPSIISNNLQTLELDWYRWYCDDNVKLRDMNILKECKGLKKLKLNGHIEASTDIRFPPNLIKLEISNTCLENGNVMNIISESCPDLEFLKFGSSAFIGEELVCNANSFGELAKLTLEYLENLKQWIIEGSAMPNLQYLIIRECNQLTLTPEGQTRIGQIPRLAIPRSLTLQYDSTTGNTPLIDSEVIKVS